MKLWNEIAKTMTKEDKANVLYVEPHPHSTCRSCKYRKEEYPNTIPDECMECGYLSERNEPKYVGLPVYRDGYYPSRAREVMQQMCSARSGKGLEERP